MRTLIVIISLVACLCARGETYFKEGMQWVTYLSGIVNGETTYDIETVTIECCYDGYMPSLGMFQTFQSSPDYKRFVGYIQEDGDKVFFKNDKKFPSEWFLFYDFGLKPGDEVVVYNPLRENGIELTPYSSIIKCVDTGVLPEYGGWETLTLEEYYESKDFYLGSGIWIKGIGCTDGVTDNLVFEEMGGSSKLMKVLYNNIEIYSDQTVKVPAINYTDSFIRVEGLHLAISAQNPDKIEVYNINGELLGAFEASDEELMISLPQKGIYIIKIGGYFRKIMAY